MNRKKFCAALLAAAFGLEAAFCAPAGEAATREEIAQISVESDGFGFQYWNEDAQPFLALTRYVEDVTDPESGHFIPLEDRVAVFDMDGTFLCETAPYYFDHMLFLKRTLHDPNYTPSKDDKDFALSLERWLKNRDTSDNLGSSAPHQSSVFAGTSDADYEAYVKRFMKTPVD